MSRTNFFGFISTVLAILSCIALYNTNFRWLSISWMVYFGIAFLIAAYEVGKERGKENE